VTAEGGEARIAGSMVRRALVLGLCLMAVLLPDGQVATTLAAPARSAAWEVRPSLHASTQSRAQLAQASLRGADRSPTRLLIDRISVDAKIEHVGLDQNRNLGTPNDYRDVAWYSLGPAPGQPGNALINGHVNWWTGSAVFTRLAQLRLGDEVVVVRGDGVRLRFRVTGSTVVVAGARVASLFAPSTVATLTLITCSGAWDPHIQSDTHRLLVSATLE
jgi:LPXTG-site transpeptidase (sortase) family protein